MISNTLKVILLAGVLLLSFKMINDKSSFETHNTNGKFRSWMRSYGKIYSSEAEAAYRSKVFE
jgi:hypothetical protein